MSIVSLLLTFSLRVNTGAAANRVFGGREIGPDSDRLFPHSVELFLRSGGGGGGGSGGRGGGGGRASHHCGGALIAPKWAMYEYNPAPSISSVFLHLPFFLKYFLFFQTERSC